MKKFLVVLGIFGIIVLTVAFNIGLCALVIYVASMIFNFTFNWWYVIGLAAALTLLKGAFKLNVKVENK